MLTVRVTPKASRDVIQGPMTTPGGCVLKVVVRAPADKGKANDAVLALLAEAFGTSKSDVTLMAGKADRRKAFRINGDPATLAVVARTWMTS